LYYTTLTAKKAIFSIPFFTFGNIFYKLFTFFNFIDKKGAFEQIFRFSSFVL